MRNGRWRGCPFGTLKRVELARALVSQPKLLLLDEPAGGLNHEEVADLGRFIQKIRDDRKLTVLLVEHHMNLVMGISDHVQRDELRQEDRRWHAGRGPREPGRDRGLPRHDRSDDDEPGRPRDQWRCLSCATSRRATGRSARWTGVSLAVEEGQIVAVLGANGAGKTTTLRAISGTVKRSGEIMFDGKALGRRGPEAVANARCRTRPGGPRHLLRADRSRRTSGSAPTRAAARSGGDVERMSGYFPWIGERRDQHAGTLSGGEQQMLALARALMSRPRLLLLDEPSLGLAPLVTREIFRIVRELNEKDGLTVLVVEQNAAIALEVASHAYVLEVGKVAVSGTSEELARDESVRKSYLGLLMSEFFQQVVAGLGSGAIYGALALALVLIHRATGVINFAQGEMAMFTTYIAWTLIENHGWSYWPAFVVTLAFAFALGARRCSGW